MLATSGFSATSTQSSNFLARATGITLTADKTNYDTLISGLVTDGTFAKLDALYIFAAPTQATAQLNLIQNAFNPTTVGTVNFSAYHGFTGDGSTFALNTGLTPNTGGTNFTLNSASLGVYDLSANTTENAVAIGCHSIAGVTSTINIQAVFGQLNCTLNGGAGNGNVAISDARGLFIASTDSANIGVSKNGAALNNAASTPNALDVVPIAVFAENDGGGTFSGFLPDQMSAAFIGGKFTNTEISNLSSRINTFMTAYSINVY